MKKILSIISVILSLVILASTLSGCFSKKKKVFSIVVTTFPIYDWTLNLLADKKDSVELTMLLENGEDFHNYHPTDEDIEKIQNCDLFIYIGGESDQWAKDALADHPNKKRAELGLIDSFERTFGNIIKTDDEHIWLTPEYALFCAGSISSEIAKLTKHNSDEFIEQTHTYMNMLRDLNDLYRNSISKSKTKTLVFADKFPFRYLCDKCKLEYYSFTSCNSVKDEPDSQKIKFLADKINENDLLSVIVIKGSDQNVSEEVIAAANKESIKIYTLNSMETITKEEVQNGASYIDIMEKNRMTLMSALGINSYEN